jgi:hypothetical protein
MQTLTNFIQSWLNESEKPLVDLYQYLRMYLFFNTLLLFFFSIDYYCQALRLQILFEQVNIIFFYMLAMHRPQELTFWFK